MNKARVAWTYERILDVLQDLHGIVRRRERMHLRHTKDSFSLMFVLAKEGDEDAVRLIIEMTDEQPSEARLEYFTDGHWATYSTDSSMLEFAQVILSHDTMEKLKKNKGG